MYCIITFIICYMSTENLQVVVVVDYRVEEDYKPFLSDLNMYSND